jgi:hypothetical protein
MKTLLQIEIYYVREYTPTCRFLKIINSTLTCHYCYPYVSLLFPLRVIIVTLMVIIVNLTGHYCYPYVSLLLPLRVIIVTLMGHYCYPYGSLKYCYPYGSLLLPLRVSLIIFKNLQLECILHCLRLSVPKKIIQAVI